MYCLAWQSAEFAASCTYATAAPAQLLLESPVMLEGELAAVQGSSGLRTQTFGLHYASGAPGALEAALHALCADVEAAVRNACEARPMLQRSLPLFAMRIKVCNGGASTCLLKRPRVAQVRPDCAVRSRWQCWWVGWRLRSWTRDGGCVRKD